MNHEHKKAFHKLLLNLDSFLLGNLVWGTSKEQIWTSVEMEHELQIDGIFQCRSMIVLAEVWGRNGEANPNVTQDLETVTVQPHPQEWE
jgi:hypothetical protein